MDTSFIYVIAPHDSEKVKIGISDQPIRRLKQLQTGHPEILHIHHTEPVNRKDRAVLERLIHKQNGHLRLKGEWFAMTVKDAILEVQHTLIRYGDCSDLERRVAL
jgi:hypothetical protein